VRYANWTFEGPAGAIEETALWLGDGDGPPLLVIPALFDEGNRLRRLTVEVMRRLAASGIPCVLPDLPGLQESSTPLSTASIELWRRAMASLALATGARRVLALRGGALVSPDGLAGWHYAPVTGASVLRQMVRARIIAGREAGREDKHDALVAKGRAEGLELAGYGLGAAMIRQLEQAEAPQDDISIISQHMVGGAALWLRAEAGESADQADALAAIVAVGMDPEGMA
jgi:pimeloyl-ACP methyl ester carboxylesterase